MTLWWAGNALLLLALPVVLFEASKIIRSLQVVRGAARDIATSVHTVGATVPPAMAVLDRIAGRCRQLAD